MTQQNAIDDLQRNSKFIIRGKMFRLKKIWDKKHETYFQDTDELKQQLNDGWVKKSDVLVIFEGDGLKHLSLDFVMSSNDIQKQNMR